MSKALLEELKSRRSIRKFQAKQIADAELDAVLEAGTFAPTGQGAQSPVIVAVQKPETVKALSAINAKVMGADTDPYYGAPTVIVVLADAERMTHVEDGSCVIDNILNAAHAVGLGSCWIHRARQMFDSPEGKALLKEWGLGGNLVGVGSVALGYADGDAPEAKPRKSGYIVKVK